MRLAFVLPFFDARSVGPDPAAYLARVAAARDLPRALAARGHTVDVVHLYPFDHDLEEGGVRHHFVAPGRLAGAAAAAARVAGAPADARVVPAWRVVRAVRRLQPDVVHFLGTVLHLNLAVLAASLGAEGPPVFVHHHGGEPARHWLARRLQRFGFSRAARVCFTTPEQAATYAEAGLLPDGRRRVVEIVETSSRFSVMPREAARAATGMTGAPVFLWAGRLDPIKDPFTALRGFARIAEAWPGARLYLHYLTDALLPDLQAWVAARPHLHGRVHFSGRVPHERMEAICNSADFLLQASVREHSGCAVLDAMACGAIPVLSDIPSFRVITAHGAAGVLFPVGDDAVLARQVLAMGPEEIATRRAAVRARFDAVLSFPALARQLEREYGRVLGPAQSQPESER
jgi:glycosyltransferase involved in cell wall biosynthesis